MDGLQEACKKELEREQEEQKTKQIAALARELDPVLERLTELQKQCAALGHDGRFIALSDDVDIFDHPSKMSHYICKRCMCHYANELCG